ncbi:RNA polymerase sigma factor [Pedobacter soli]|uniref:RNA polymerase sigma-70 factor, ECF subfamily n=1 Tax=Pedobacter soli TaxID=390242 RepID=A0A1G6Z958_9SPHI|nr:RNA polymerase sigma-70 factor [Pedobacter soli]SDD99002.1 RNA polymerase sigma-70 factor, ECF subfamily [Pedobacter soli]
MSIYKSLSDQELIIRTKANDHMAYTEIYDRYKKDLQTHIYKKTGNFDEVKDILQEIFINLWINRAKLPVTDNLSGYLYISARNKILNIISHKNVESNYIRSLQLFIDEANYVTDLSIRENELTSLLKDQIENLPPKMGEVFSLSRFSNFSHKEISTKLNISEQTVSKQISNAIKILKSKLNLDLVKSLFI